MSTPKAAAETEVIAFEAQVSQVRTLADGGIRVVLDLPEDSVYQAAWLMEVKRAEGVVQATCKVAAST